MRCRVRPQWRDRGATSIGRRALAGVAAREEAESLDHLWYPFRHSDVRAMGMRPVAVYPRTAPMVEARLTAISPDAVAARRLKRCGEVSNPLPSTGVSRRSE